jgi:hypothetical protein
MASQLRSSALRVTALLALSWLGVGCGPRPGAGENAKSPNPTPAASATPTPPPAAPVEPAASPAATAPGRLPSEILSVPDKAWVFSFEGSAAYDKAKTSCD